MLKNLFTPEKISLDLFGAKKTTQAKTNVSAQQPAQKGPQEQQQQQPQTQEKTQPFDPVFGPIRPTARQIQMTENRELEAMRLELMRLQTENVNLRAEIERLKQSQSDIKRFQVLETS